MNRAEFIDQLKKRLAKLPHDEVNAAVQYYEEYFDDAGAQNEQAVIAELGDPAHVASQIMANFAVNEVSDPQKPSKRGLSTLWIVILAVFASPITLPLAIAAAAIVFSVVITVLSVVFSFGVTAVALLVSGVAYVVLGFAVVAQSVPTMLVMVGTGLFAFGFGMVLLKAVIFLSKKSVSGVTRFLGKFILRRSNNETR